MKCLLAWFGVVSITLFADSFEWGESGIQRAKYADIQAWEQTLQDRFPQVLRLYEYGKSIEGRPLRILIVAKQFASVRSARPAVLMTGSIHGNEYLGIEDKIPEELIKRKESGNVRTFLDSGGVMLFVPVINPDGYEKGIRENAHGVDLNRDWDVDIAHHQGFKETETKLLSLALESLVKTMGLQLKLTVDYHCCAGALLHPLSFSDISLPEADLQTHLRYGESAKRWLDVQVGSTGKILGYYPVGTSKDYYYTRYKSVAMTFEGRYKVEGNYLDKHVSWWDEMLGLNMQPFEPLAQLSQKLLRIF